MEALQILIDLGFNSVLTSGQEEKAIDGLVNLKNWHNNLGAQITIMPGSGINASNCLEFKKYGFKALHLSGSKLLTSISIPEKVNSKISFLHQKIGESNQKNIRAVVDKLTN
jgi:copper homeostasis protein